VKKEIEKLLERSEKDYNKISQRAELLQRNKKFLKKLNEVKDQLCDDFFKKLEIINRSQKKGDIGKHPLYSDREFMKSWFGKWIRFCEYWDIDIHWDGQLESIVKCLWNRISVVYHPKPKKSEKGYLAIYIDAATTLEDIRSIWSKIEKYQKEWFGKKIEKKRNFGRDLCWYDLYKAGFSYREIAEIWNEKFPDDKSIDLIIIRKLKKNKIFMDEVTQAIHADKELKSLKNLIFKDGNIKDKGFLFEIKDGKLANKFKFTFDDEKETYVKGKGFYGKGLPQFLDTIRQAIGRMEKYISQTEVKEMLEFIPEVNLRYGIPLFP